MKEWQVFIQFEFKNNQFSDFLKQELMLWMNNAHTVHVKKYTEYAILKMDKYSCNYRFKTRLVSKIGQHFQLRTIFIALLLRE